MSQEVRVELTKDGDAHFPLLLPGKGRGFSGHCYVCLLLLETEILYLHRQARGSKCCVHFTDEQIGMERLKTAQGYTESGKARFLAQATWLRISALNSCASANIA